jgi:hypothetical protein
VPTSSGVLAQFAISGLLAAVLFAATHAQGGGEASAPKPTLLNPYRLVQDWPTLPASMKGPNGKKWGEVIRVHVAPNDNIYVGATYESVAPGQTALRPTRGANNRAIVIGDAMTGALKYLIPDPGEMSKMTDAGTSALGIAVDAQGNIYAADVGFNNLRKYARLATK